MPDEPRKTVGDSVVAMFERIGAFFDLFDLSFFVSGAAATSAVAFVAHRGGFLPGASLLRWPSIVGLVLLCYVLGLVCFAAGRAVRTKVRWTRKPFNQKPAATAFDERLLAALVHHGLADQEKKKAAYASDDRAGWRDYARMWADVRGRPGLAPSLTLLNRYWVMAATYDGIAMAFLGWAAVLCVDQVRSIHTGELFTVDVTVTLAILLVGAALLCFREAARYMNYQIEELAATLAALRDNPR